MSAHSMLRSNLLLIPTFFPPSPGIITVMVFGFASLDTDYSFPIYLDDVTSAHFSYFKLSTQTADSSRSRHGIKDITFGRC